MSETEKDQMVKHDISPADDVPELALSRVSDALLSDGFSPKVSISMPKLTPEISEEKSSMIAGVRSTTFRSMRDNECGTLQSEHLDSTAPNLTHEHSFKAEDTQKMPIKISVPQVEEMKPRIAVFGVGGAGGNAVNNMITSALDGVDFVVANTDSQALTNSAATRRIQLGGAVTQGLGAGSVPEVGRAAAEESAEEIMDHLQGCHMAFIAAGMGGGTGTGAAPVIARSAREAGVLTVGVVTKPFQFEGTRRMRSAETGIEELQKYVDTLIVIPNQNLFCVANEKTTFAEAFQMADNVLAQGVRGITDLMVKPGIINLDFADVKTVMHEMGKAVMGTGEISGEDRAVKAAQMAISNPLLEDITLHGAKGVLISIAGGMDMGLHEVDQAAKAIQEEVDTNANIIFGTTLDPEMDGNIRVTVIATGMDVDISTINDRNMPQYSPPVHHMSYVVPSTRQNTIRGKKYGSAEAPTTRQAETGARAGFYAMPAPDLPVTPSAKAVSSPRSADVAAGTQSNLAVDVAHTGRISGSAIPPTVRQSDSAVTKQQNVVKQEHAEEAKRRPNLLQRMVGRKPATKVPAPRQSVGASPKTGATMMSHDVPLHAKSEDDDMFDIPAFLRRQAN